MKHLFILILTLLCTSFAMAAVEEKEPVVVYTADDFIAAIRKDHNANIKLGADIQLGILSDTICSVFSGSIDGLYDGIDPETGEPAELAHVIYGDIDRQAKWTNHGLFGRVAGAKFKDLIFQNFFIDSFLSNTGLIARRATNSEFYNVTFEKVTVYCDYDDVGVIAGLAKECVFGLITTKFCDIYAAGLEAGGLVGNSDSCHYEICVNNPATRVYADGRSISGGAYVGGFCGYSYHDNFTACVNAAMIGSDEDNVGGFTGKSLYSDFYQCENSGYVVHSRHDLFKESADKQQQKIEAIGDTELASTIAGLIGTGVTIGGFLLSPHVLSSVASSVVRHSLDTWEGHFVMLRMPWYLKFRFTLAKSTFMDSYVKWVLPHNTAKYTRMYVVQNGYMKGVNVAGYCRAILVPLAIVLAVEVTTSVIWDLYAGDDEAGGFSAQAQGGTFEQCTNLGNLRCKDDDCGGIVGLGYGVTINNCFNSGSAQWDEDDTTGSILGKAKVDSDNGDKQCLVTNCLSTWAFHIVGDEDIDDGLSPASGNNFRLAGGKGNPVFCEMQVSQSQIESGLVAMWLNQGIQNRSQGMKPWRQNMWFTSSTDRDKRPYLDDARDEVTVEKLATSVYRIRNADQLMAFAQRVNDGDQFASAWLDADIDLSSQPWIPIGKDQAGHHFRGIFDGHGHTIRGLKCKSNEAVGLFGAVHSGAEIINVNIAEDCEFSSSGSSGVGAIVGLVNIAWDWGNVVIDNCSNSGQVIAQNMSVAGGILGLVKNTSKDNIKVMVNNCWNLGTVFSEKDNSALLCGYMRNSGVVTNCWSGGKLKTFSSRNPFDYAQGRSEFFVGYWDDLEMHNCYVIDPMGNVDGLYGSVLQDRVNILASEALANGALAYQLNNGVIDGTQTWYQKIGTDPIPVRNKLPDGTNMVFSYLNQDDIIGGYANTSCEEITDVITGKKQYADHSVTDINHEADNSHQVTVSDLVQFIAAAGR